MEQNNRKNTALTLKNQSPKGSEGIDLLELYYRLLEKAKFVVFSALFCAVLAFCITYFLIAPQYTSTAKLYVLNAKDSAINLSDLQLGNYLASDFKEVFDNHIVHERVIENLGLDYDVGKLSSMVSVNNPVDTRILYISVTSKSPKESMMIANEYAAVAREFIAAAMDMDQPNTFEDAVLPTKPTSPSKTRNTIIGFLAGLFLSVAIISISFVTGDKIRTSADIQKYIALPTLGMLPSVTEKYPLKKDQNLKKQATRVGQGNE